MQKNGAFTAHNCALLSYSFTRDTPPLTYKSSG